MADFAERPFDLDRGPLLRALLCGRGPAESVLALAAHHIVVDRWSLRILLDELCTAVSEIEQTSGEGLQRRDVAILRSMPGIGRINLGTLLSEASGPLSRRDYEGLRTLSGAAPVTKRSGKSLIVVRRYAAHVRLRDTVYHWARVATQRDPKCRARYTALRKRGHSHGRALRGIADRLLALACVLLQRQTLFDPHFGQPTA